MQEMEREKFVGRIQDHDMLAVDGQRVTKRGIKLQVVDLEECGRVVGKILAPINAQVFGPWRGAVYLTRD